MYNTHTAAQPMLPGQAAAPEGPVDLSVMYVMHHGFRRDLSAFTSAARHTPIGDRATWRLLAERWGVFSEVLHMHHSGEDAGLWPWLLERGTDADREVLEAMEAEHALIDPLLSSCAEGFSRLAGHADDDARAALVVRLTAARESLGQHLAHEETDALAILQRLMTQEEWLALDEEYFKSHLSPRLVVRLVPWAGHGLPPEVLAGVLAGSPLGFRVVWRLTHRRFARREARAFAYA